MLIQGKRIGEGRLFKLIEWRVDRLINSISKTWICGPIRVTRSHTDWSLQNGAWVIDGITNERSPFYLEPYTDWHISVSIGRLNLEGTWHGQTHR